jgi:hypothetical protein
MAGKRPKVPTSRVARPLAAKPRTASVGKHGPKQEERFQMIEIRIHGRGGEGVVTAARECPCGAIEMRPERM